MEILSSDQLAKISTLFDFGRQELQTYQDSMNNYEANNTFDFLLKDTLEDSQR
eukprot:CAMPEP_0116870422 /NCGR_PEP_ID=MMETSP0463-20121206/309_1 /TAXON_ID=181622 /ORGANISM="Strombidinopsis sp, Strain SopsisLIS2011" /LENGTH=52 /DNA_ID=CAMNT_0004506901 /DNA_START=337 /DNA_END=495 /DNA_ORIENTATION=+